MGKPVLTIVAGPNGSGKTTLSLELQLIQPGNHLNADDLAKAHQLASGLPLNDCERWAFEEVRRLQTEYISQGRSHSYETVLSHPDHIHRAVDAKNAGFHTRLIYVFLTSPDENVRRVAQRRKSGGHDVPEDKIRARYTRSLGLLRQAVAAFDCAIVMTNEGKPENEALELIAHSGLVQSRSSLDAVIFNASQTTGNFPELGFHQGKSLGAWTEYARDRSILATSSLYLKQRRSEMLAAF